MHIVLIKAIPIVVQAVMEVITEVVVDGLRTKLLNNSSTNDIIENSGVTKHDHRCNCGNDRTPAQKLGDKKRRKY